MRTVFLIIFITPLFASAKYDFNLVKECFVATQLAAIKHEDVKFVTKRRKEYKYGGEQRYYESSIDGLFLHTVENDQITIHVIQDLNHSYPKRSVWRRIKDTDRQEPTPKIRQSFKLAPVDYCRSPYEDYQRRYIKIGTDCENDRGTPCFVPKLALSASHKGICPFLYVDVEPNGLSSGKDITQSEATRLIKIALANRLTNLKNHFPKAIAAGEKGRLKQSLSPQGACSKMLGRPITELSKLSEKVLCLAGDNAQCVAEDVPVANADNPLPEGDVKPASLIEN